MDANILTQLTVPFYSSAVEWKPQAISADKTRALAAAYVDMREYEDRLDQVYPEWSSSVQFLVSEKKVAAIVSLTIDGVTRVNVGEASLEDENAFTSAYAQGFKRACSDFGLGRYLYHLPQVWCDYDEKRRAIIGAPELPAWARHPEEKAESPVKPVEQAKPQEDEAAAGSQSADIGDFIVPSSFKKHGGMKLSELPRNALEWYAYQMDAQSPSGKALQAAARAFLAQYPA